MILYRFDVSVYTPFAQIQLSEKDNQLIAMWDDWTSDSKKIGDFTNASVSIYNVCKRSVYQELSSNFKGLIQRELIWEKNPLELKAKNPKRLRWLPVDEPGDLVAFYTDIAVSALPKSSLSDRVHDGEVIGKNLIGVEERRGRGAGEIIIHRVENQGIFISSQDVKETDFFHPVGLGCLLCKPCVKEFVEQKEYSNVQFLEYGEIL